jgi:hypothetical protein
MTVAGVFILLSALAAVQALPGPLLAADAGNGDGLIRLFNGRNLEGFDTFLKTKGLNNDPEKVFQVQDGTPPNSNGVRGRISLARTRARGGMWPVIATRK